MAWKLHRRFQSHETVLRLLIDGVAGADCELQKRGNICYLRVPPDDRMISNVRDERERILSRLQRDDPSIRFLQIVRMSQR